MASFVDDFETVNPLQLVESQLGNIETWPSNIIKSILLMNIIARTYLQQLPFFFGNKVPLHIALDFYSRCNEHGTFPFWIDMYYVEIENRLNSPILICTMWESKTDSTRPY